ncbi:uncharacterized protein BT62DRAFT_793142 [Guyanagaster necrorhizus]|uniref:Uncharacterized protein n=1 Tax=Guyanagaster necrorhizus TaxID=856835 RepID=A0A9P7VX40_9AGAR|nr:uncharacterized protein BT62DRAFT_793142 [Guyanagaster necrorhizus MCA 3950]KAG7447794.1 hypothetical protein BT62DRAFT_793142 [Guyanagaster necrorhizus MCA 3950]
MVPNFVREEHFSVIGDWFSFDGGQIGALFYASSGCLVRAKTPSTDKSFLNCPLKGCAHVSLPGTLGSYSKEMDSGRSLCGDYLLRDYRVKLSRCSSLQCFYHRWHSIDGYRSTSF